MSGSRAAILSALAALLTPDGSGNLLLDQSPAQFDNSLKLMTTAAAQTRGLQSAGIITTTASSTLTTAYAGSTLAINSSAATTQTLPAASSFPNGGRIEFFNIGTGTATVARAGSDTIRVNGATATSLTLLDGDTVVLASDGTTWYAVGGSVNAFYSFQTSAVLTSAGYQKLIGGAILQWGSGSTSGGVLGVTFPIAFPHLCFAVTATINTMTTAGMGGLPSSPSTTGFTMNTYVYSGGAVNAGFSWMAIGY